MDETDRRFVREGVREWRATGRWRCSSISGRRRSSLPSPLSSESTWPSVKVRRVLPRMDGLDTDRGDMAPVPVPVPVPAGRGAAAAAGGEAHE